MEHTLSPHNGYIVIEPSEEGETMAGSIILPDLGKEKPAMGKVVAVSNLFNQFTNTWVECDLKVGDKVLIPRVGSLRIPLDNKEYFMCKFTEVLATLN